MATLHPEIEAAIVRAEEATTYQESSEILEEALRLAQRVGTEYDHVIVRLELVETLFHVPTSSSVITHFAALRQGIGNTDLDSWEHRRIMWCMKWALNKALRSSAVALPAIEAMVDDVQQLYRRHGYHLRPILAVRAEIALARDDVDLATQYVEEFHATPRDDMSDCLACEPSIDVELWSRCDPARAMKSIDQVISQQLRCAHQPAAMLSMVMYSAIKVGNSQRAEGYYRRGIRQVENDRAQRGTFSQFMTGLAQIGRSGEAAKLLAKRRRWDDDPASDWKLLQWSIAVATVAVGVEHLGDSSAFALPDDFVQWGQHHREVAHDLAGKFDQRNGNNYWATEIDRITKLVIR